MPVEGITQLSAWMSRALDEPVRVLSMSPLKGGGIQENWTVEAEIGEIKRAFVLRKDAPASIDASHTRRDEFALISAAHRAGVTVPEPIGFCDDPGVVGGPFALMAKVSGGGLGPKIVKELKDEHRGVLTDRLAQELARIHSISPSGLEAREALAFLPTPPADFAIAEVNLMRSWLDKLKLSRPGLSRPGLEWALRWCELHIPKPRETTLIHRDYRTGNYMVDDGKLTAILDWEFACWGDPMFDIGWFMAGCWRFSRADLEAGGIGERQRFYAAYKKESGRKIDDAAVRAYEVLSHCRWAVIALQQGERHSSGREPSLEHALTGRIAEEVELAALKLTKPAQWRLRHDGGLGL